MIPNSEIAAANFFLMNSSRVFLFGAALMALCPSLVAQSPSADGSRANLKTLAGAVRAYGILNKRPPANLAALMEDGLVAGANAFVIPGSGHAVPARGEVDAKGDYTLESLPGATDLVVREKQPTHTPGQVLAIFKDGTIKAVTLGATTQPESGATTPGGTNAQPRVEPTPATSRTVSQPEKTSELKNAQVTSTPTRAVPGQPAQPVNSNMRDTPVPRSLPPDQTSAGFGVSNPNPGIKVLEGDKRASEAMPSDIGFRMEFDKTGRLLVTAVYEREMGSMLGIRVGDVVDELENKPTPKGAEGVVTLQQLARLAGISPGDDVILGFRHFLGGGLTVAFPTPGGEPPTVNLIPPGTVFQTRPEVPNAPRLGGQALGGYLGVRLQDNGTGNGVVVAEIAPRAPAEAAGLKRGDLVIALDGEPVQNSRQLVATIAKKSPGQRVDLLVFRAGKNIKVSVDLGTQP